MKQSKKLGKLRLTPTDKYVLINGMYFRLFEGVFFGQKMKFPIPMVLGNEDVEYSQELLDMIAYHFPPNELKSFLPASRNEVERKNDRVVGTAGLGTTSFNNN